MLYLGKVSLQLCAFGGNSLKTVNETVSKSESVKFIYKFKSVADTVYYRKAAKFTLYAIIVNLGGSRVI